MNIKNYLSEINYNKTYMAKRYKELEEAFAPLNKRLPNYTMEETEQLMKKAANDDENARNQLVLSHIKFVIDLAADYAKYNIDYTDLIETGIKALINFTLYIKKDFIKSFQEYASIWIINAFTDLIALSGTSLYFNTSNSEILETVRSDYIFYTENTTKNQSEIIKTISQQLKISEFQVTTYLFSPIKPKTKNSPDLQEALRDIYYTTPGININTPEEKLLEINTKEKIKKAMSNLSIIEQEILDLRYGLSHNRPESINEIALKYNLTTNWVHITEKIALNKLRKIL